MEHTQQQTVVSQHLQQRKSDIQQELVNVQQELVNVQQELVNVQQELMNVYAGTAWRMTKLLRVLADHGKPLLSKAREKRDIWIKSIPESSLRYITHQLRRLFVRVLKKLMRKAKHIADTNPQFAYYLKKLMQRFPSVHQHITRILLRSHHSMNKQILDPSQMGGAANALYTKLKSNT
jgi:hypothetical protein